MAGVEEEVVSIDLHSVDVGGNSVAIVESQLIGSHVCNAYKALAQVLYAR